nr:hypothetical protein [Tanacetum cinerariifolium]GEX65715.1 hypothetical protein [Tanacetum cinerariifolium]
MEEHREGMKAYKKVQKETVRSELMMEIMHQSMEMDMWEIKGKLAERRDQIGIRAYEKDKRHEELNQKTGEVKNIIQIETKRLQKKESLKKGLLVP